MDTQFLAGFVAFAQHGSVVAAARHLNIAPSTLALRIRSLEKDLGFALMTRSGRIARPTSSGAAVALRAEAILRDLRELKMLSDEAEPHGQLRLGVAQTAITTVLCDVLPEIARKYPNLEITVQKGSSSQIFAMVNDASVDGAFLFHPPWTLPKGFVWHALREEKFVVIADGAEEELDPLMLLRERPFVRYDRLLWSGQIAETFLRRERIQPNERVELDALDAIAVLVDRGLGVSLVPDRSIPWPAGLGIVKHGLGALAPVRNLGLLWPINSSYDRVMDKILQEVLTLERNQNQ
ncbi:DNA-binding transcriptional regulator, LysR family [Sphingomonas sp. OK281]|nr:DNA-binding transcriptional regulator, LysR family [Sphingomonas sp. OK281]